MLLIQKIKIKELVSLGPNQEKNFEDLALPELDQSPKELVNAVIEAYDLGELTAQAHTSNPNVLKATVEKGQIAYHLSAVVKID